MTSFKDFVESELALFAMFVICAHISESAGGTALFSSIAPVFKWISGAFFLATLVYPLRNIWKILTSPAEQ